MKIAFFEVESWEQQLFEIALPNYMLSFQKAPLTLETIEQYADSDIISTFIYSKLATDILAKLPNLKLIATRSTGFDHIDLKFCKNHDITVCNVPTYGVDTVAEHTFALILALSRKLMLSVDRTRKGNFMLTDLRGFDLSGKTLGIVGLGNIGARVAEIARVFKMKVIATTRSQKPELGQTLGVSYVDLPTLLLTSDIVTLHTSLSKETYHLINRENIATMKKGSLLINTARGAVIETEAIVWALEQGILAGAALDVLEEECVLKEERALLTQEFLKTCDLKTQLLNHVLLTKENVIVTPHNAFNSNEALRKIVETTVTNIASYSKGNPVNVAR